MTFEDIRLFTIPIARLWLHETPALRQEFLPEMLRRYEAGHYGKPVLWDSDRLHTSFAAAEKDQVIGGLPAAYERVIRQFTGNEAFDVRLWHSIFWKAQEYEPRHHHIPSHLTLIHFLAFDKGEHRPPVFYDPAQITKAHCRHDAMPVDLWEEKTEIEVFEGDVLVFPSYLEHHIPPTRASQPRVTVSMTVTLRK
jgi:hypothetical protein